MHVELDTQTKMFCGCAVTKGDDAQHAHLPGVPGAPRRAAGGQPARRRVRRRASPWRSTAPCSRATSSTARTTSIPTCPRRTRSASTTSRWPSDGWFEYWVGDEKLRCRINRVHMEEDAAKLVHAGGDAGRIAGSDYSMVDFNRGGTPLIEIVSEPDIPSPEAAREFLQQLRNLVIELGVSECNMEEGQIRWDANISVRPGGQRRARHAHRAQEHEQLPLPAAGARGRDPAPDRDPRGRRHDRPGDAALRPRHGHHDAAALQGGGARLPLLPRARPGAAGDRPGLGRGAARDAAGAAGGARGALHRRSTACSRADALVLGSSRRAGRASTRRSWRLGAGAKPAANWTMGEYLAHLNAAGLEAGHGHVTAERLAKLVQARRRRHRLDERRQGRLRARWSRSAPSPRTIVEKHGLGQISDTVGARGGRRRGRRRQSRPRSSSTAAASSRSWASSSARS